MRRHAVGLLEDPRKVIQGKAATVASDSRSMVRPKWASTNSRTRRNAIATYIRRWLRLACIHKHIQARPPIETFGFQLQPGSRRRMRRGHNRGTQLDASKWRQARGKIALIFVTEKRFILNE